jgi:molybdopterin converting factor small subunit
VEAGTTVEGLLRRLAEEYDEGFLDAVIRQTGEPMVTLLLLNGRTLQLPHDLQRELQAGDQLHLIPPIAGG